MITDNFTPSLFTLYFKLNVSASLGISQNSEDISQALETFRMIKSRIRRDSRQFVFMIYGTAFLKFTTITLSFNKMCIKTFQKFSFNYPTCGWFLASVMKLKNWIIIPARPSQPFPLDSELSSSKHLRHPPSPGGSPGALIRNLRGKDE